MSETFSIGTVTLPQFPQRISFKAAADAQTLKNPGSAPIVLVYGGKVDVLRIEGWIRSRGNNKSSLTSSYVTPLRQLVWTEVNIVCSGRTYSGEDFIFMEFQCDEEKGIEMAFPFKAEFWRGDVHVVL